MELPAPSLRGSCARLGGDSRFWRGFWIQYLYVCGMVLTVDNLVSQYLYVCGMVLTVDLVSQYLYVCGMVLTVDNLVSRGQTAISPPLFIMTSFGRRNRVWWSSTGRVVLSTEFRWIWYHWLVIVSRGQTLFAQGRYRFQYKRPARKGLVQFTVSTGSGHLLWCLLTPTVSIKLCHRVT